MIHSTARTHGALTKALSLPREQALVSMPDSQLANQDGNNYTYPAGELAATVQQPQNLSV